MEVVLRMEPHQISGDLNFELRPAEPHDAPFLIRLYASTIEPELAAMPWTAAQKEAFVSHQSAAQRQSYESRYPDARQEIIVLEGRPVGRFWVGRDSVQLRLLDITLLPEGQGRGIGSALIRELQAEARATGKVVRHCVFKLNDGARRLYQRLGFVTIEDLGAHELMEWRPE